ncbi:DUF2490 domain-containing protein [Hyphobacterium sp. CCMP332]|nr:DUF2490 domain-containing protein [Hyphobacterium sp. CCMP332]
MRQILLIAVLISILNCGLSYGDSGEDRSLPPREIFHETGIWYGLYTKYMIANKLFYYGEYHVRRTEWNTHMNKLYLRFGLAYLINPSLEITAGFVNPYSWYQVESRELEDRVVPEFRFWQQFLFVQEVGRLKLYHQFRFEERWKRDHFKGEPYHFSQRYRYKFTIYTPLNHNHIQNKTVFLAQNAEIFIQSGQKVIYNNLEEIRVFNGIGYLLNNNWQFQLGYAWHYAQKPEGHKFRHQDIIRMSVYHNMDLRRNKGPNLH